MSDLSPPSSYSSSSYHYLLLLVVFGITIVTPVVDGMIMDAEDLALGNWDITVKRHNLRTRTFAMEDDLLSMILPIFDDTNTNGKKKGKQQEYCCTLSLYPNRTFTMIQQKQWQQQQESPEAAPTQAEAAASKTATTIHGKWKMKSNPYCVTDRFYDELELTPHPRRLIASTLVENKNPNDAAVTTSNNKETVTKNNYCQLQQPLAAKQFKFKLHCRMWGRYGNTNGLLAIKRGRQHVLQQQSKSQQKQQRRIGSRVRLTHGILLLEQDEQEEEKDGSRSKSNSVNMSKSSSIGRVVNDSNHDQDEAIGPKGGLLSWWSHYHHHRQQRLAAKVNSHSNNNNCFGKKKLVVAGSFHGKLASSVANARELQDEEDFHVFGY